VWKWLEGNWDGKGICWEKWCSAGESARDSDGSQVTGVKGK